MTRYNELVGLSSEMFFCDVAIYQLGYSRDSKILDLTDQSVVK